MLRFRSACAIALMLSLLSCSFVLAQGEGNGQGADFSVLTDVNAGDFDAADQEVIPGAFIGLRIDAPMNPLGVPIVFGSIDACGSQQPSRAFAGTPDILGINIESAFVAFDGLNLVFPLVIGPTGQWQTGFNFPALLGTASGQEDFFLQGGVFDPSSPSPFGWSITNTIRLSTVLSDPFQNGFPQALCASGLTDADVGTTFMVDTDLYANNYDVLPVVPGTGTTTNFTIDTITVPFFAGFGADVITRFTSTTGGVFTFSTEGSSFNTVMALAASPSQAPLIYNDDRDDGIPTDPTASVIEYAMNPGETVFIIIEGFDFNFFGPAQLTIMQAGIAK